MLFIGNIHRWVFIISNFNIETLEKGIYNDFRRVHSKGKSLADIPKKEKIWYKFLLIMIIY